MKLIIRAVLTVALLGLAISWVQAHEKQPGVEHRRIVVGILFQANYVTPGWIVNYPKPKMKIFPTWFACISEAYKRNNMKNDDRVYFFCVEADPGDKV